MRFDYGFDRFWTFTAEGAAPELGYMEYLRRKHGSPAKFPRVPGTCPWPDDPLGRDVALFKYPEEDFDTDWITTHAIEYLRSRKSNAQPWFLFTSCLKPHSPSVEPQPYFGMYDPNSFAIPKLPANAHEIRAAKRERRRRQFVDDERMVRVMSAKYFGAITHVDLHLGTLLGELERLGMADDTLVLFTADDGNMLGDHGRWFKGVQYEGSAHVPLLWKGPKGSAEGGGRVVDKVIENTDLMPTILEAAGLPVPDGVQGRSFRKLAAGKNAQWKDRCFSQLRSGMLLKNGWKFIDNSLDGTGALKLYDLPNDPKEDRNLADDPRQRDRRRSVSPRLGRLAREAACARENHRHEDARLRRDFGRRAPRGYSQCAGQRRERAAPRGPRQKVTVAPSITCVAAQNCTLA